MKTLFIIVLAFSSFHAWSNKFQLIDTAERFTLVITKEEVSFNSEVMDKLVPLNACSLKLAQNLNGEYLSLIPKKEEPKGINFLVDGNSLKIDPKGALAKKALSTQPRMIRFFLEVKSQCP